MRTLARRTIAARTPTGLLAPFIYRPGDVLPGQVSSRASIATYLDSSGILQTAASGVLRDAHYIGGVRHTIVEVGKGNSALWCRDLTNVVWNKTNLTATKDQIGVDGAANSATRLTATAANATAIQAIAGNQNWTNSVYIKRVTGVGTVQLTNDNGATWTTVTVTGAYTRVFKAQSVNGANVGIRLVTSGDEVCVDYWQTEPFGVGVGSMPSSAILTTTVSVNRSSDTLYWSWRTALPQELTTYIDVTDDGYYASSGGGGTALIISDTASTSAITMGRSNGSSSNNLTVAGVGGGSRNAGLFFNSTFGDEVEMWAAYASDATIRGAYSLNRGALVYSGNTIPNQYTQAPTLFMPQRWGMNANLDVGIAISNVYGSSVQTELSFRSIKVVAGVYSLESMRTM